MPIRDVAGGVTGGIGPVRYVETGVTVNIPIGYVVENGVTALVYKEEVEEIVYTPTGDTYDLYNRGVMSEVLGGFTYEGDGTFAYTEEAGYLAIRCTKGVVPSGKLTSNHIINLSEYNSVIVEYGFVSAATGAEPTTLDSAFAIKGYTDGDGHYNFIILKSSPVRITRYEGFWEKTLLEISPTSASTPLSSNEDVILRIYSIVVIKITE